MQRLIHNTCEQARDYAVIAWAWHRFGKAGTPERRAEHLDELARRADFVIGAIEAEALLCP